MLNGKEIICPICENSTNKIMKSDRDKRAEHYMLENGIKNEYKWYLCQECGNGFQFPAIDNKIVEYIWNINRVENEDKLDIDEQAVQLVKAGQILLNYYYEEIKDKNAVLDLGCGYGGFVKALQDKGFNAIGIDIDQNTKQMHNFLGIKTEIGFVEEIMPNSKFDVIFSNYALYFFSDVKEFLENLKLYLNEGGVLCITLANFLSNFNRGLPGYIHSFFPNKYSIQYLLNLCGYEIVSLKKKKTALCIIAKPSVIAINHEKINIGWVEFLFLTKNLRYYILAKPLLLLRRFWLLSTNKIWDKMII